MVKSKELLLGPAYAWKASDALEKLEKLVGGGSVEETWPSFLDGAPAGIHWLERINAILKLDLERLHVTLLRRVWQI